MGGVKTPISVIVPAYNAGNTLKQTLQSILNQSYADIELILINDASTDTTAYIGDTLAKTDPRIKVYNLSRHEGATMARIKGVEYAQSEWVMFVDADDILPYHSIEALLAFDNSKRDIISGTITLDKVIIPQYDLSGDVTPLDYVSALLRSTTYTGSCAKLIRKTLFYSLPRIPVEIKQNEDILMMSYISMNARDILILNNLPVYNYMQQRAGMSKISSQDLEVWFLLFKSLKPCIESFNNIDLTRSYIAFIIHRLYHFCIQRGLFISIKSHNLRLLADHATIIGIDNSTSKMLRCLQSPILQRLARLEYIMINSIKTIGRYCLERTSLLAKRFILEKIY